MRAFLYRTVLILLAFGTNVNALDVANGEKVRLAQQVHAIFEAKCVECHGSELARPKGKFGYVLDLKRLAENPDYVVPGNPADSEIYNLVLHNEMPGEDSDIAALTPQEVELVKQWIEIGAPGDLPAKPDVLRPVSNSAMVAVPNKPADPLWKSVLRWIGKLHPVSTHFPVALMFAAVLAEGIGWLTRRDTWLQTVRFLVVIAALGAMSATVLGWINAYFSSYDKAPGAVLWWHRWLGTGTAMWAVVCAISAFMGECREGSKERTTFRVALTVGAVLVGISGFLGSALIFGLDHYSWH